MNDYKRFVSYIYNYEMKVKKNNIGYARVEIKDNDLKITIHIQVKSISKGELTIYAFVRQGKNIRAIPLGTLNLRNGVGDYRIVTKTTKLGNTEYSFDEVGGLLFYQSEEKYFGTEWDDQGLAYRSLMVENGKSKSLDSKKEKAAGNETKEVLKQDNETNQKENVQPVNVDHSEQPQQPQQVHQSQQTKPAQQSQQQGAINQPQMPQDNRRQDFRRQDNRRRDMTQQENKNQNMEHPDAPKEAKSMQAASVENVSNESKSTESVLKAAEMTYDIPLNTEEIRPYTLNELFQEFAYQPTDNFMMHGYKRFGHLGLVKRNGRHIIGVPGIFCRFEQQIAKNSGYQNFLPKMGKSLEYGDFGYWYRSNEYLK